MTFPFTFLSQVTKYVRAHLEHIQYNPLNFPRRWRQMHIRSLPSLLRKFLTLPRPSRTKQTKDFPPSTVAPFRKILEVADWSCMTGQAWLVMQVLPDIQVESNRCSSHKFQGFLSFLQFVSKGCPHRFVALKIDIIAKRQFCYIFSIHIFNIRRSFLSDNLEQRLVKMNWN